MYFNETKRKFVGWIYVAQDGAKRCIVVSVVMKFGFPHNAEIY
jgi:hypothetical protein